MDNIPSAWAFSVFMHQSTQPVSPLQSSNRIPTSTACFQAQFQVFSLPYFPSSISILPSFFIIFIIIQYHSTLPYCWRFSTVRQYISLRTLRNHNWSLVLLMVCVQLCASQRVLLLLVRPRLASFSGYWRFSRWHFLTNIFIPKFLMPILTRIK